MKLFAVKCSANLAAKLGARLIPKLSRPDLSFPVYEPPNTYHAELQTEIGLFAWLWTFDENHQWIEP